MTETAVSTKISFGLYSVMIFDDDTQEPINHYTTREEPIIIGGKIMKPEQEKQAAQWNEEDHPRDNDGKFGAGSGKNNDENNMFDKHNEEINKLKENVEENSKTGRFIKSFINRPNLNLTPNPLKYSTELLDPFHGFGGGLSNFMKEDYEYNVGKIKKLKDKYGDMIKNKYNQTFNSTNLPYIIDTLETRDPDHPLLKEIMPNVEKIIKIRNMIQDEMNHFYTSRFDEAESLFRGTSEFELECLKQTRLLGKGCGKTKSKFNTSYITISKNIASFFNRGVIIEYPKDSIKNNVESHGYDLREGEFYERGKPQNASYFSQEAHRLESEKISLEDVKLKIYILTDSLSKKELERMTEKYQEVGEIIPITLHEWRNS